MYMIISTISPDITVPPSLLYCGLTMSAYSFNAPEGPESGTCDACNEFFICKGSLTKHHKSCHAARKLSKKLWRNGASNVKKLNVSQTASRKQIYEEVQPHEDYNDNLEHVEQPASKLVSMLLIFLNYDYTHCPYRMCSSTMLPRYQQTRSLVSGSVDQLGKSWRMPQKDPQRPALSVTIASRLPSRTTTTTCLS
jgi:hypothetical protein